jgi:hypothetical protein
VAAYQPAPTPSPVASDNDLIAGDHAEDDMTSEDGAMHDLDDAPESEAESNAATPSNTADFVAPRKKGSPAFDYLLQQLRSDPNIIYADLRARCALAGFTIAPIMYGRAKAVLGLVPVKPRKKKGDVARPAPTGAPMQFRQVESVAADRFAKKLDDVRTLDGLISAVKELDGERRRLRDLLERVVTMIDEALG